MRKILLYKLKPTLNRRWFGLFFVFSVAIASAQEAADITISGKITDAKGEAVPYT